MIDDGGMGPTGEMYLVLLFWLLFICAIGAAIYGIVWWLG